MIEPVAFALAALALLAMPGPTNAFLVTSGAAAGLKRSAPLIAAAAIGYTASTVLLALLIGPLARASHELNIALRILCGGYLFYAAWKLWREGAAETGSDKPVSFHRVLIATTLNPKGVVFAFVIVPYLANGQVRPALPYVAALSVMAVIVGALWTAVGAVLRTRASATTKNGLARRAGAITLGFFATLMVGSVFTA